MLSLHRLERSVLSALSSSLQDVKTLEKKTGLSATEVQRAVQWLEEKKLIRQHKKETVFLQLGENGKLYSKKGLPERIVLTKLSKKEQLLAELMKEKELNRQEISASIGALKQRGYILIKKNKVQVTAAGQKALQQRWPEEQLLKKLATRLPEQKLSQAEKKIVGLLEKRKDIVERAEETTIAIALSPVAQKLDLSKATHLIDKVTPGMLREKTWRQKKFRRFTLNSFTPKVFAGRKQPYRLFLDELRKKFVALGFKELSGPLVETEFWNMDALFMPQFHSARDIHDAYYIKEPSHSTTLPKHVVQKVKQSHERGMGGSKGWRYQFDTKRTHRHLLRTHDTAISPRALASPELQVPGKYFQMARCFRYDVIDATHLADFNQIGGFVVEEDVNLRHLFGLLKLFAEEFCQTDQIKVTPAYFPFTEPSASLYAKHPEMGWIELAGSGIFRPEMCRPLGVKQPVIAWGVGLERLAMVKLGIQDIRQLFSQDLAFLRTAGVIF